MGNVQSTRGFESRPLHSAETKKLDALHKIARSGDVYQMLKVDLMSLTSRVNLRTAFDEAPLHFAAFSGNVAMVCLLLCHGANVNATDDTGMTPLHWALIMKQEDVALNLILNGASVQAADIYGITPLHWCAYYGLRRIALSLLEHGAQKDAKDKKMFKPLDIALGKNHQEIVELLKPEKHGVKINKALTRMLQKAKKRFQRDDVTDDQRGLCTERTAHETSCSRKGRQDNEGSCSRGASSASSSQCGPKTSSTQPRGVSGKDLLTGEIRKVLGEEMTNVLWETIRDVVKEEISKLPRHETLTTPGDEQNSNSVYNITGNPGLTINFGNTRTINVQKAKFAGSRIDVNPHKELTDSDDSSESNSMYC